MEFTIDPDNIENVDNDIFAMILSCLVIQRNGDELTKITPFLMEMTKKKVKKIWKKIQPFFTFDDRQWFKNFIKDFSIES